MCVAGIHWTSPIRTEHSRDESKNFAPRKMAKCDVWRQLFFLTKSIDGVAVMCRLLWKIYFEFRSLLRALPFYFPRDITSFPRPRAGALANYLVRNSTLIHSHFANSISLGARDAATPALSSYSTEKGKERKQVNQWCNIKLNQLAIEGLIWLKRDYVC